MTDTDFTLTSPMQVISKGANPLLGLTIVWHTDQSRIGEQFVGGNSAGLIELSRFLPLFCKPGKDGLALGHSGVSRDPIRIVRDNTNGVEILLPASRMVVELNGSEIHETRYLSAEHIAAGQILGLGRTILVCLHWMRCLPKNNPISGLLGVSSAAIMARDKIHQVAATDVPVLLLGETGTGKEIAARAIHALSKRTSTDLVTVNMAALNESLAAADLFGAVKGAYTGAQTTRKGLFAEAEGATLFLDEIGNTPSTVQPMLLRVLEGGDYRPLGAHKDQHSSARIIAATDQDLDSGSFNQALLRRLESFVIHLPPLRARREDIGVLIVHLLNSSVPLQVADAAISLPTSLITQLANYDWPGNIRQLAHVLKRAVLALQMGEAVSFDNLVRAQSERSRSDSRELKSEPAPPMPASKAHHKKPAELGEQTILAAMEHNDWRIKAAAQELGISRPSMYKLLETHTQIRRAEQIPEEEIRQALETNAGVVERCASMLRTPSEALRRHLRGLGLLE
ncbi:sigma-54-dependent transcriptional regulator [Undibacterium sp. Rencai35W]|uniref:sigma-54-dependent transcriptional regulator n=1 Tax=Undibacterium sp. Rencai35W TaxID=3413046 RepID=UPI003BF36882